jgi:hypothetical protein
MAASFSLSNTTTANRAEEAARPEFLVRVRVNASSKDELRTGEMLGQY